jgi:flagellin
MGKTLEKLSSGYRINRAADDAAGLGISEKMRAQIRGNQQAMRNVQDGISMLQTGEGAMDEVHSMLQRIRELAVQAANGTYTDNGPERTSIGQEIVQLANEIDRIANSTEFNGQKLLTGNLSIALGGAAAADLTNGEVIVGPTNNSVAASDFVAADTLSLLAVAGAVTVPATMGPGNYTFGVNGSNIELRQGTTVIASANSTNLNAGAPIAIGGAGTVTFSNGLVLGINNAAGSAAYTFARLQTDLTATANDSLVIDGLQATAVDVAQAKPQTYTISSGGAGSLTLTGADGSTQTLPGLAALTANESRTFSFSQLGVNITLQSGPAGATIASAITALTTAGNATIQATGAGPTSMLQVGANVPDTLGLTFTNMQTTGLGGGGFTLGGTTGLVTTLGTQIVRSITDSHNLMTAIDGAIQQLNVQRGTLGAAQNRLEHSIRSLGVAIENLSSSESRIRDADIATLSSDMVSNQILQQAGVSVLSQANQAPQAILKLLQG